MAVHGALAAFNPQEEDWSEYSERLAFYSFTANVVWRSRPLGSATPDYRQRHNHRRKEASDTPELLWAATFRLLRSLVLPAALEDFSFDDLVAKAK